ncbi:MAG TPA: alpha/beta hydrolase [Xanthobacteraceae bacterium]|nr:alpha/beta hydrolase [Xanthobacteraceae bacterium]
MRLSTILRFPILLLVGALTTGAPGVATAEDTAAYGPELQEFEYPWPVAYFAFTSQGEAMRMAYMDVKPAAAANGKTAVLFHGKNFCAATWEDTIAALREAGFRVIAVDQIGFCKSTKPAHYQFTFQQLAGNTHALLVSLGIEHATIIGHSMGGMLGMRYALMYPNTVDQLVLVDPIGLEDWKEKGVPWQSVDAWYQSELKTTADSIRNYQRATYYAGTWDSKYDRWVQMLAGLYRGPGRELVAWNAALVDDMAMTQPVFYEFEKISVPVLLMIGDKDNTAVGKNLAPPEIRATLGNYPVLGKQAAARMPHARLVEFPNLGHAPQIQAPDRFHRALFEHLGK